MGYTHYWHVPAKIEPKLFDLIVSDFKKLLPVFKDMKIQLDDQQGHEPIADSKSIFFNGVDELSHETFSLEQTLTPSPYSKPENGLYFEFCKTNRKPCDLAVCSVLIIAQHYTDLLVTSDGTLDDEWQEPITFVKTYLGYGTEFKLGE